MRVDAKMRTKKADSILNRVHVAMPAPRDQKERTPFIPGEMCSMAGENTLQTCGKSDLLGFLSL